MDDRKTLDLLMELARTCCVRVAVVERQAGLVVRVVVHGADGRYHAASAATLGGALRQAEALASAPVTP